jgi:hypothetical protein
MLGAQLGKLETRATELKTMTRYLRAKIGWIAGGEQGLSPGLEKYTAAGAEDHKACMTLFALSFRRPGRGRAGAGP